MGSTGKTVDSSNFPDEVLAVSGIPKYCRAHPHQFPPSTAHYHPNIGDSVGFQPGAYGGSYPHAFSPSLNPAYYSHLRSNTVMPHPFPCNMAFYQTLVASGLPRFQPVIKSIHHGVTIYYPTSADGSIHPSVLLHAIEQLVLIEGYFYPTIILPDNNEENPDKITSKHRDNSVTVLKELHEVFFQLPDEVFSSAVNMFDRFLSLVHSPPRCAKLVIACCYFISAECTVLSSELPLRSDLLCLIGKNCYDINDFIDWETSIRGKLCVPNMPLAAATPLQYLRLFAAGYGLTRTMTRLLNNCLTRSEFNSFSPRVLAMSVFYGTIPKSEWDSLGYVKVLAQLCGIRGQPFIGCSLQVMRMAKELQNPSMSKVYTSLQDWRDRSHLVRGERRTTSVSSLQNLLDPILEE